MRNYRLLVRFGRRSNIVIRPQECIVRYRKLNNRNSYRMPKNLLVDLIQIIKDVIKEMENVEGNVSIT